MNPQMVGPPPVPPGFSPRTWWSNRNSWVKFFLLAFGALLVLVLWMNFSPASILIGVCAILAIWLAFSKWKWPTPGRRGWIVPIALAAVALVALLSYTSINPRNHTVSASRSVVSPVQPPVVPGTTSGDQVSKVVIDGNSYSVTGGKLETIPLVHVSKNAPHKAAVPVRVFVVDKNGKPASGVAVSVNGQSGKTGSDGSFTASNVVFENKDLAISGRSDLALAIRDQKTTAVEVWALNSLDGSFGQPALTKEQAMGMLSNPQFVASLKAMCPGITVGDIVGLDQVRSTGQSMIFLTKDGQLANSPDQIPAGQPVWSFKLAAGKSCEGQPAGSVMVNPVCQNVGGKVPGNAPTGPSVPTSTPTPVQTPAPTPVSAPAPTPSPTKNPGNAPLPPPPPPPSATPAPTYPPPTPRGTITITGIRCSGGSCTFSWSAPGTASGWVRWGKAGNSLDHSDTAPQSGGSYSVTEANMVVGTSYQVIVYAGGPNGTESTSTTFTA